MNQKPHNHLILYIETPAGLQDRILLRVEKAAKRKNLEMITAGSIVSIIFGVAIIVVGKEILAETAISGFGQYVSLIFSSGTIMITDWRDFAWTIIESAPITGFAVCLGVTGMFITAIRWTGRTMSDRNFNRAKANFAL